jgi:dTDP-4-dehydrorhamnose reductase
MKQKVLIVGSAGFLGRFLFENLQNDFEVFGTYNQIRPSDNYNLSKCDVFDKQLLSDIITEIGADIVINCVGLANVDYCELHPESAWTLNALVPYTIMDLCKKLEIKYIHISTDHFTNLKKTPIQEDEKLFAVNQYGKSKLFAEEFITKGYDNSLVIRSNFLGFSIKPNSSFLSWAYESLLHDKKILGFADVIFTPVSLGVLANAISQLILSERSGTYNVSSSESITKFDLLIKLCKIWGFNSSNVVKCTLERADLAALRPLDMSLNNSKISNNLGYPLPDINDMISDAAKVQNLLIEGGENDVFKR